MSPLVLVAAGGLARETQAALGPRDVVLVDDDPVLRGRWVGDARVVGPVDAVVDHPDREVVVCAGSGAVRRALVARLTELGVEPERYATVVHPGVLVPPGCTVGRGSIVLERVTFTADVQVGEHVVLMPAVTLTHDVVLDDYVTVCAGASLGGAVHVREAAYLGMNASVRQGVEIGAGAVLGMGAALLGDLPAGEAWVGVPARPVSAQRPPRLREA